MNLVTMPLLKTPKLKSVWWSIWCLTWILQFLPSALELAIWRELFKVLNSFVLVVGGEERSGILGFQGQFQLIRFVSKG